MAATLLLVVVYHWWIRSLVHMGVLVLSIPVNQTNNMMI
jgi:hypothetical protein